MEENNPEGRMLEIKQLHCELLKMLRNKPFDSELRMLEDLNYPIQVFVTNSGIDRDLYNGSSGSRDIQYSLDRDRHRFLELLLEQKNITLVMGDPRLDKMGRFNYVSPKQGKLDLCPWIHNENGKLWQAEQAEAWMYEMYLEHIKASESLKQDVARLIMVSAYTGPEKYHRVLVPDHLAKYSRIPNSIQEIDLPRKSFTFDPVFYEKWPNGAIWIPDKLVRVVYKVHSVPITVYGLGQSKNWHSDKGKPHNSIRDLWMVEHCADLTVALHNGESKAAKYNYEASVKRDIPSILVTFDDAKNIKSRKVRTK